MHGVGWFNDRWLGGAAVGVGAVCSQAMLPLHGIEGGELLMVHLFLGWLVVEGSTLEKRSGRE